MTKIFRRQQSLLICSFLAVITTAVYWPVHHFEFTNYDDNLYIAENPHLRGGLTLRGLGWALTTPLDQWMPVTWLVRMFEYQLFGLDAGAHHLVNVVIHVANALLLFSLLNRMTNAIWRSALVAALFALHPLHVESVAWATGLKDVLSMCFGLLTIWAYVRYVETLNTFTPKAVGANRVPPAALYSSSLVLFTLALMSKPMAVTLPFVLLLLDYWPLGRTPWARSATGGKVGADPVRLLSEKLPFLVLAAAACVTTVWAQRAAGPLVSLERLPPGVRIANALLSYTRYLGKTFWPTGLAVFYPLDTNLSLAAAMAAGVGLAGVTAAVIWRVRRAPLVARSPRDEPWLVTGWFWFLGTLVPVIGLVQVGVAPAMADRYAYVPLVGLFMMLCWSVPDRVMERRVLRVIISIAAVTALTVCVMLTRIQIAYWKDTETLFRHALNVTRGNWLAHNNLGIALGRAGKIEEAIGQCEEALRIKPDFAEAHCNLGIALEQVGQTQEAIAHYEEALRIKPDFAEAHYMLGNALSQKGDFEEAIGHYKQALKVKPDLAETHYNLGVALERVGRMPEAMADYEEALRLKPDFAEAHNNLGVALKNLGDVTDAIGHYEEALRFKPGYADAHYNLGVALVQMGRVQEAIGHWDQALQLKPDYVEAHYNLGVALARVGRVPEAIEQYEEALRLKPDLAGAQNALARLRATQ